MKLRNNKTYHYFDWKKSIYLSQLKASNSIITPIRVGNEIIYDGICGNSYLVVTSKRSHKIIKNGVENGYLTKDSSGKIISQVFLDTQSFIKNKNFILSLANELKKNCINCKIVSYVD